MSWMWQARQWLAVPCGDLWVAMLPEPRVLTLVTVRDKRFRVVAAAETERARWQASISRSERAAFERSCQEGVSRPGPGARPCRRRAAPLHTGSTATVRIRTGPTRPVRTHVHCHPASGPAR
jgi:hypothetical protein